MKYVEETSCKHGKKQYSFSEYTYHAVTTTHSLEPLPHSFVQARILLAKVLAKCQMSSALTSNQVTVINTKQGTTGLPALFPPAPARQHVLNMPVELVWDSMPSMP